MRRTAAVFLVLSTASVAHAEGAGAGARSDIVNDPFLSDLYVSPAQLYQASRPSLEGAFVFAQGESKLSATHLDVKAPAEVQGLGLIFEAPVPQTKVTFRGSVSQFKTTSKPKSKATGAPFGVATVDDKQVETETTVSPALAYDATAELSVGAAFDIVSDDQTHDSGGHGSFHYTKFLPGVTFHRAGFEVGLFYEPTININDADGSVNTAGAIGLHGSGLVAPHVVAGGVAKYLRSKDLDGQTLKNNVDLTVVAETRPTPALMAGVSLGYASESANTSADRLPDNISTESVGAYGSIAVAERAAVGLKLARRQTGSQHGKIDSGTKLVDADVSTEVTIVALTGTYAF